MMTRTWYTVTVMDGEGGRYSYSLDVNTKSPLTGRASVPDVCAHEPGLRLLIGRIHHVHGARLKTWIGNRQHEWRGRAARCSAGGR
jgi:hypothetical protein